MSSKKYLAFSFTEWKRQYIFTNYKFLIYLQKNTAKIDTSEQHQYHKKNFKKTNININDYIQIYLYRNIKKQLQYDC